MDMIEVILAHELNDATNIIEGLIEEGYEFLDNPFTDVHWSEMEACLDSLADRKVIIRTIGNTNLIDHLEFQSEEGVRQCFYVRKVDGSFGRMEEGEAEEFFGAYEVGIEHVSEILRNRGLW